VHTHSITHYDCMPLPSYFSLFFFFTPPAPTEIYTLSLHDALPISHAATASVTRVTVRSQPKIEAAATISSTVAVVSIVSIETTRSEEHTSELQSRSDLVCRLLLEKKKQKKEERTTQRERACR